MVDEPKTKRRWTFTHNRCIARKNKPETSLFQPTQVHILSKIFKKKLLLKKNSLGYKNEKVTG